MMKGLLPAFAACLVSAVALAQASLTPDGTRLEQGNFCYTMTMKHDGVEQPSGFTFQSIHQTKVDGVDALAIVVHQHLSSGKFDMRDSFLLRRSDLRPIRLDNDFNGAPHVHLDYTANHVSGWKMVEGRKEPIDVAFDGPTWDGNLWGELFAALPLQQGARYQLPMYQYDSGKGSFFVNAAGKRPFATASGSVSAWTLKAGIKADEQYDYFVGSSRAIELGYAAGPSSQHLGGDCGTLR